MILDRIDPKSWTRSIPVSWSMMMSENRFALFGITLWVRAPCRREQNLLPDLHAGSAASRPQA
jgi:hypothetical protein